MEVKIIQIPIDFLDQFRNNPDDSLRDIAGIPTVSIKPLFENPEKINLCVDRSLSNPLDENYIRIAQDFKPSHLFEYYGHLDGSQGGDGFGICIAHVSEWVDDPPRPIVTIDLIGAPSIRTYGRDFKPALVEDLVEVLIGKGLNLKIMTYDRATDISSILRMLEPHGTIVEAMSIDRCTSYPLLDYEKNEGPFFKRESTRSYYDKPMTEFRDVVNGGRLRVPYHEAWYEIPYTFEHDNAKRSVKKMAGKKDDLGQAAAGAIFNVLNNAVPPEGETFKEFKPEENLDRFELELKTIKDQANRRAQNTPQTDRDFDMAPDDEEIEDDFLGGKDFRYYT